MRCLIVVFLPLVVANAIAQQQSIKGQLYRTPDQAASSAFKSNVTYKDKPVEVIVFEQVGQDEVLYKNGHIQKIGGHEVARAFCKWDGSFKIKVRPGKYSVFAYIDGSYYGNLMDADGNLSPVTVVRKRDAWITITMNIKRQD